MTKHLKKRSSDRTQSLTSKPKMATMRAKPSNLRNTLNEREEGGSLRKIKKHGTIKLTSNVGF